MDSTPAEEVVELLMDLNECDRQLATLISTTMATEEDAIATGKPIPPIVRAAKKYFASLPPFDDDECEDE
jgi:hypothetical protein